MNNIDLIQSKIIAEFAELEDWMDKYSYLIDLGKDMKPFDEQKRINQNLIEGCQSRVWLHASYKDGKIFFEGDSDAILTKGLVSLITRIYNDQAADDIINSQPDFIQQIGLSEHLSPTRSNGLNSMLKQIKLYAMAFKTKYEQ